ncbi:glycosyltransferase family 4 protein [Cellulomonas sp. APG4]|uniref:glycosyltransferase family 4 protein n=1 Tax=Cellulomonas sp. APG4 TaxID=1538656 RepID=UPI00137A2E0B|nr:glycosyltransferase family 4 protein [Cellulomonas sp. APG4]NCT91324.1 glycosyltransferase family 4 protein [Cellulomonas sp. APG4]
MTTRPHLLYVAWAFPPCRAAGVYRALATANAFRAAGWRVTVLTTTREAYERYTGTDDSLEDLVDPEVDVHRVPFTWPAQETDVRTYSRLRVVLPPLWRRLRRWADMRDFPEAGYGPWRRDLVRAAREVHRTDPVDLVISTANPHVTFEAARALHREHGVPYVMDYRDAWVLDVFSGRRLHGPRSRQARTERGLVADAREVWFVNEPIRQWHAQEHPGAASRMHVVANGWDPGLTDAMAHAPASPEGPEPSTAGVRFGYLGTVTPKVPLSELLAGWRAAVSDGSVPAGSTLEIGGYLGYFAVPRPEMREAIAAAADVGASYAGPVRKAAVAEFYAHVDALVLALGAGRYVTSGKVFEYLSTGRPIVSVHDPGNAASQVLEGYPLWFPARSLAPEDVAAALAEAARAVVDDDDASRTAALEFAAAFRRDRQLTPRIAALRTAVAR